MADIVNLNRVRKAQRRLDKADQAATNRAKFGRTKAERERERAEKDRAARELAGKRVDKVPD